MVCCVFFLKIWNSHRIQTSEVSVRIFILINYIFYARFFYEYLAYVSFQVFSFRWYFFEFCHHNCFILFDVLDRILNLKSFLLIISYTSIQIFDILTFWFFKRTIWWKWKYFTVTFVRFTKYECTGEYCIFVSVRTNPSKRIPTHKRRSMDEKIYIRSACFFQEQ